MYWKSETNTGFRTIRKHGVAKAALTLLVMTIGLFLAATVLAADAPTISPKPSGTIQISKTAGLNLPNTATGADLTGCSTQNYAGNLVFFWPIPEGSTTAYSMRFDAAAGETLTTVSFSVYDPGDGSFGDDSIFVKIYSDSLGRPGTLLNTKTVPAGSYPSYPTRTVVNYAVVAVRHPSFM